MKSLKKSIRHYNKSNLKHERGTLSIKHKVIKGPVHTLPLWPSQHLVSGNKVSFGLGNCLYLPVVNITCLSIKSSGHVAACTSLSLILLSCYSVYLPVV